MTGGPNNEHSIANALPMGPAGTDSDMSVHTLTLDPDAYGKFLAESDLSESQQQELLATLWEIIVGFVDLGFQLHPIQQAMENSKLLETDSPGMLDLENISDTKQTAVVKRPEERLAERTDS